MDHERNKKTTTPHQEQIRGNQNKNQKDERDVKCVECAVNVTVTVVLVKMDSVHIMSRGLYRWRRLIANLLYLHFCQISLFDTFKHSY